jgi:hypothetical protein
MSKPDPNASGPPRKRKPGAGRKPTGRTACPPRILPSAYADLQAIAAARQLGLGETIEALAREERARMEAQA